MATVGQPTGQYARLLRASRGGGRTREDAEDLVQEAYSRLIEYQRTTWVRDEEGFLRRVAHNLAINLYHRRQVVTFVNSTDMELEAVVDDSPSIERILTAREHLEQIAAMLSAVSRRTCDVFLAHRAGFVYQEIAEELGISTRTVKKHISRAVAMIARAQLQAAQEATRCAQPATPSQHIAMTVEQWADVHTCLKGYPRSKATSARKRS